MDKKDESLPLNTVMSNQLSSSPVREERRRFKFNLDESNVEALLNGKRRQQKHKSMKGGHYLFHKLEASNKRDPSVYNRIAADNLTEILQLPKELLPSSKREALLAAKKTTPVYAKPEHWIVQKKPTITAEEKCQREKESITRRMDTMKVYSRAAKCLNQARESASQIGPIRKKRSPVFDGLICSK